MKKSNSKLSLARETIGVLGVRSNVRTGYRSESVLCSYDPQHCPTQQTYSNCCYKMSVSACC
jgi:hypothetical protein